MRSLFISAVLAVVAICAVGQVQAAAPQTFATITGFPAILEPFQQVTITIKPNVVPTSTVSMIVAIGSGEGFAPSPAITLVQSSEFRFDFTTDAPQTFVYTSPSSGKAVIRYSLIANEGTATQDPSTGSVVALYSSPADTIVPTSGKFTFAVRAPATVQRGQTFNIDVTSSHVIPAGQLVIVQVDFNEFAPTFLIFDSVQQLTQTITLTATSNNQITADFTLLGSFSDAFAPIPRLVINNAPVSGDYVVNFLVPGGLLSGETSLPFGVPGFTSYNIPVQVSGPVCNREFTQGQSIGVTLSASTVQNGAAYFGTSIKIMDCQVHNIAVTLPTTFAPKIFLRPVITGDLAKFFVKPTPFSLSLARVPEGGFTIDVSQPPYAAAVANLASGKFRFAYTVPVAPIDPTSVVTLSSTYRFVNSTEQPKQLSRSPVTVTAASQSDDMLAVPLILDYPTDLQDQSYVVAIISSTVTVTGPDAGLYNSAALPDRTMILVRDQVKLTVSTPQTTVAPGSMFTFSLTPSMNPANLPLTGTQLAKQIQYRIAVRYADAMEPYFETTLIWYNNADAQTVTVTAPAEAIDGTGLTIEMFPYNALAAGIGQAYQEYYVLIGDEPTVPNGITVTFDCSASTFDSTSACTHSLGSPLMVEFKFSAAPVTPDVATPAVIAYGVYLNGQLVNTQFVFVDVTTTNIQSADFIIPDTAKVGDTVQYKMIVSVEPQAAQNEYRQPTQVITLNIVA